MNIPTFDERASTWDDDPRKIERAAQVARQILAEVSLCGGARVLDFGAGTGLLGMHFVEAGAVVTFADPSAEMRRQVDLKLALVPSRGCRAIADLDGEEPASYELVVSLMALHHVDDPAATIAGLAARLVEGGRLAICDLQPEDGSFHDPGTTGVHHGFAHEQLTAWCDAAGLRDCRCEAGPSVVRQEEAGAREYPLFLLFARRES